MTNKHTPTIILLVCSSAIGFILSKYFQIPHVTLAKEVDGVNLLAILVSIVIAYVFYKYFDKAKENRVREKELIIARVEEIYQYVKETSNKINDKKIEYTQATSSLKRLVIQIKSIEKLLNIADIQINNECRKEIIEITRSLRELQTDSPSKSIYADDLESIDLPIKVKEGIIFYSESRFNEINSEYDKLKNKILEYQLVINRA
ncbi:hypothetical protein KO493_03240 [Tamlana agarivorans]|uniref:Uncharacterized protein n=1 Tax=Pseudotamlana agarivorans TaxID=481183 RepID=A0ACC5U5X1_9FLAO|nr:hypothetical protein [Tamlana agarivorans]MBU2949708.1 hypothetical protein [Tamlana agarivorans]